MANHGSNCKIISSIYCEFGIRMPIIEIILYICIKLSNSLLNQYFFRRCLDLEMQLRIISVVSTETDQNMKNILLLQKYSVIL